MKRQRQLAAWMGAILGTLCALLLAAAQSQAEDRSFTEEFHQTYALSSDGRVALENINGAAHISVWDRNEVKVDAVKYAGSKERLDDAQIRVDANSNYISIRTEYREHNLTFSDDDERHNPASVEYALTVPRNARLDEIKLINGSLDVTGVAGETRISLINGRLTARELSGPARLATVNGRMDARFGRLSNSPITLKSVNGSIELTLPSDSQAEIEASTVHGGISNDFGLGVRNHEYVGHDLRGELGSGGPHIRLENVNGRIEIHHANDNRALSPVKDLNQGRDRDSDDEDDDDI
jgi:DUF4097 and DUF4098 domain-containing protein YvlB